MSLVSTFPATAPANWRADLRRCAIALALLMLWDLSGADLVVMHAVAGSGGFALRDNGFVSGWLHDGGRALGWLVFAAILLGLWFPLPGLRRLGRGDLLVVVAACLACVLMVNAIKHFSLTSCPWSLAEFGGTARYVSHWSIGMPDGAGGGCFPSGHATTAFSFLPLAFALRGRHPALARAVLAVVAGAGIVFGTAQMLRGAHYPSHIFWTAWLCLAVSSAVEALKARWR